MTFSWPIRYQSLDFKDLRIVGSNDQDIIKREWRFLAPAIDPCRFVGKNSLHQVCNFFGFLDGGALVNRE